MDRESWTGQRNGIGQSPLCPTLTKTAPSGCRHQHDPRLARHVFLGHQQHLRRSRSRMKARRWASVRFQATRAGMAKEPWTHGLPAVAVRPAPESVDAAGTRDSVASGTVRLARRWPFKRLRHITAAATQSRQGRRRWDSQVEVQGGDADSSATIGSATCYASAPVRHRDSRRH